MTKAASEKQVFAPGENVEFTVVVTNNSVATDPVTITSLVDSIHGDLNGQGTCAVPQIIQPGKSYTCKFTALVDGDETDRVTASGVDNENTPVSAYAEATVEMINPSLTIVKTTNGDDGLTFLVGTPLTWSYLVTNNGDVPLANITVTDDKLGAICTIETLAAGASTTCTATGTAADRSVHQSRHRCRHVHRPGWRREAAAGQRWEQLLRRRAGAVAGQDG